MLRWINLEAPSDFWVTGGDMGEAVNNIYEQISQSCRKDYSDNPVLAAAEFHEKMESIQVDDATIRAISVIKSDLRIILDEYEIQSSIGVGILEKLSVILHSLNQAQRMSQELVLNYLDIAYLDQVINGSYFQQFEINSLYSSKELEATEISINLRNFIEGCIEFKDTISSMDGKDEILEEVEKQYLLFKRNIYDPVKYMHAKDNLICKVNIDNIRKQLL